MGTVKLMTFKNRSRRVCSVSQHLIGLSPPPLIATQQHISPESRLWIKDVKVCVDTKADAVNNF